MTTTDYWSTQGGRIHDVLTLPMESGAAILEGSAVKFGTAALDKIIVNPSVAFGDGWGIALKEASAAGEVIPILMFGIYKCERGGGTDITVGQFVFNSITTKVVSQVNAAALSLNKFKAYGGSSYFLGMALHPSAGTATSGDKLLVLIGKTS